MVIINKHYIPVPAPINRHRVEVLITHANLSLMLDLRKTILTIESHNSTRLFEKDTKDEKDNPYLDRLLVRSGLGVLHFLK